MGGLALKHLNTERKDRVEYEKIVKKVSSVLRQIEPKMHVVPVVAYEDKSSFGDADILCSTEHLTAEQVQVCMSLLGSKGMVYNGDHKGLGDVFSIEVDQFQVDLLRVPKRYIECARTYFAYNDLGNLMGRVAHKMGFKYGFLGLDLPLRLGTHQFDSIKISTDTSKILNFLGFDPQRHAQGFKTLEDIFQYAKSSMYFNSDIYLLENQNAKARVRDEKRPTYQLFLKYLSQLDPQHERFEWQKDPELKAAQRAQLFVKACVIFEEVYPQVLAAFECELERLHVREFLKPTHIQQYGRIEQGKTMGMVIQYLRTQLLKNPEQMRQMLQVPSLHCPVEQLGLWVHDRSYENVLDQQIGVPQPQAYQWLQDQLQCCIRALQVMDIQKDSLEQMIEKQSMNSEGLCVDQKAPLSVINPIKGVV